LKRGGRIAIGGDSHIGVDPAEEIKALEYSQRLLHRRRNVAASAAIPHTAARLWRETARHGAAVLGLNAGALEAGMRADLVVIDTNHVSLAARSGAQLLDSYVFAAGRSAVRDVMVGGRWVVEGGRHAADETARGAYVDAVKRMLQS
jgi:formimidoylglutamate deiminase